MVYRIALKSIIMKIFFLFVSLWVILVDGETKLTTVIETDKGSIRGKIHTTILKSIDYAAFLGIPYAESPVGNLRFKPPLEKKPWSGIMNATSEGNVCPQFDAYISSTKGSENCLFLNVYTPHTSFDESMLKPVMVYIHGGGYTSGSSGISVYGPDFILETDVIVVSFNYRLNAFGFLNLNHERATGNMGLKDQNAALKWVNRNIVKFGGNPKKVTIFGYSSGSASVDLHVLSDMSVGLFQQSISMSGSPLCLHWGFQVQEEAEGRAFALGSLLGINTDSKDELLKQLLKISAHAIVNATNNIDVFPFRPTIENSEVAKDEDKFLTQCSLNKYMTGNYTKGPHMMGMNSNEMLFFKSSDEVLFRLVENALDMLKSASIPFYLPTLSNLTAAFNQGNTNITEDDLEEFIKEASDLIFNAPIDAKQRLLNINNKHPIYYYRFAFDSIFSLHKLLGLHYNEATHGDELPYLFYMPLTRFSLNHSDIASIREKMVQLWTNFAKYGNPTPDHQEIDDIGVKWIESGEEGKHLEIDKELSMGSRPINDLVKSLQSSRISASPVLDDCSNNLSSRVNEWIVHIFD